jgi:hypothetical protein
MFHKKKVCAFCICSPIDIILYGYPYRSDDRINPKLSEIMNVLDVKIDIKQIENIYVHTPCNQGDILVFGDHANNCIVFDLYKDPTDQLDIIYFGVVCNEKMYNTMYELIYGMYKEIDKKVKFSAYDINSPSWEKAVINGEDTFSFNSYRDHSVITQKIIYII